ncbi:hypothetical protein GRS48_03020 [Halorubrum sp. JWXQ-INN 858]|uniref:hypothetical protein n=1 Tax=Halorubrum sp. JWXQ-INN 858 TaxID=2690782 RepID=UPI0013F76A5D|nr:hypothetical protein [Halorubrum sp. JWXQ-INN 858]MWV63799.1 hypothetical protein [Halorubrum sp. JWXQ-INN 858]
MPSLSDGRDGATASRRTVLGGLAALVGATGAGVATLATASDPAAAVDGDPAAFEIGDAPTVTSNDGRVESVFFSPELDVSWTDFGDGVDEVTLVLAVGSDRGVDRIYEETLTAVEPAATPGDVTAVASGDHGDADGHAEDGSEPDFDAVHGGMTVAFDRVDATARGDAVTSGALSDADLVGGETATTTLDVVYRADVVGGDDAASVVRTAAIDLSVTNPAGDAAAGGVVDVDAS